MKQNIVYSELPIEEIDSIKGLWTQQCNHHEAISTHFSEKFAKLDFNYRKETLMSQKNMQTIMAYDGEKAIGYIISIVDDQQIGEVFSLYVNPQYRKQQIGDTLMKRSLKWLKENNIKSIQLSVAVGNDQVIDFYKRYNFMSYTITLEQL